MPILRDDDPRVGCLAVPLAMIGGFVLGALVSAAVGAGASLAWWVGVAAALVAAAVAAVVLGRTQP